MPITREPSQRALHWVKWNSSKSSLNSSNGQKRTAEPEIVHLGGARVGTAFEVLDLPAPDRSKPAERPLTQWAFNPPPPNPPGIGIAIAGPGDSSEESPGGASLDNDRPITQWFPALQPGADKTQNEPQDQLRDQPRSNALSTTASLYASSDGDTTQGELPSPFSFGSSGYTTPSSPPAAVSPLRSPVSSPVDSQDGHSSRLVQFPKRSTSLSQASRYTPRSTARATEDVAPLSIKEKQLRRTQSNAESQRQAEWRGPSPQPVAQERLEGPQVRDPSPREFRIQQETLRVMRRSPKPLKPMQDPQSLPPLTSAPPNAPLPPISGTKLAGHGKTRDQPHRRGRSSSSDRGPERSPPRQFEERADGQESGAEPRLTPKERLWLHRHYRGEAMFLKAWGLQITSEEDREEGRGILRELMEGEAQEERENQARQRMHHRSGSQSRSSTATTSSGRDGNSLDVIAEERYSREFHLHSETQSPGSNTEGGEEKFWRVENDIKDPRRGRRTGSEKHSRNESTDSVLGEYLDLRLSNRS